MPPNDNDDVPEYLEKLDKFLSGEEQTTLYLELEKRNWAPDLSDNLSDEELSQALTNLLWSLKDLGIYIEYVDHISDRDLYALLLPFCDRPAVVFPNNPNAGFHWSPIGSWEDEDYKIWLRYYATPEQRAKHAIDYPDDPLPPAEPMPYPRPWIPVRVWPTYERSEDEDEDAE